MAVSKTNFKVTCAISHAIENLLKETMTCGICSKYAHKAKQNNELKGLKDASVVCALG